MKVKKYSHANFWDVFGYFILWILIPFKTFRWFINPHINIDDALSALSFSVFLILYLIAIMYFSPRLAAITEIRNKEIRFFNPFSTRWAPIDHYRYIAKDSDPDSVMVYKRNCKKIGRIPLKSAGPEEKREFLEQIEPWLTVENEGKFRLDNNREG